MGVGVGVKVGVGLGVTVKLGVAVDLSGRLIPEGGKLQPTKAATTHKQSKAVLDFMRMVIMVKLGYVNACQSGLPMLNYIRRRPSGRRLL
jgi:hypothetical protein